MENDSVVKKVSVAHEPSLRLDVVHPPVTGSAKSSSDAVDVDIKMVKSSQPNEPTTKLNKDEAEKLAQQFDNALRETQIQFKVSPESSGGGMHFVIVEKKTGKVIREFPPEEARAMRDHQLQTGRQRGLLVEKTA